MLQHISPTLTILTGNIISGRRVYQSPEGTVASNILTVYISYIVTHVVDILLRILYPAPLYSWLQYTALGISVRTRESLDEYPAYSSNWVRLKNVFVVIRVWGDPYTARSKLSSPLCEER